jgi:transposase
MKKLIKTRRKATEDEKNRAVQAVLKQGKKVSEIGQILGRLPQTINKWIREYKKDGIAGLRAKKRSGRPSILSQQEKKELKKDLQNPATKYGHKTDLWTLPVVMRHIKKKYKKKISKTTVWKLLKGLGLSSKKAEKRYYEADKSAQKKFLKEELPEIKKKVKKQKAKLYYQDEATIQLGPVIGRTWGPKGKKSIVKVTGNIGSISVLSAITEEGELAFKIEDGTVKSKQFIAFLKQVIKINKGKKVHMIVDNAKYHTSREVQRFLKTQDILTLSYFPKYSPYLNPDEKVWNHLKHCELKCHKETTVRGLKSRARSRLQSMAKRKSLVRSFYYRSLGAKL